MADMNKYIGEQKELYDFCQEKNLIDSITLMNPELEKEPTYLYGSKRIDYILITLTLAETALKVGHHQYYQHFITDHKGVYIQFRASDLFDTDKVDRSHEAYRRLRLGRRDIVTKYITRLEFLYAEHCILERAEELAEKEINAPTMAIQRHYFKKFHNLDLERVQYM